MEVGPVSTNERLLSLDLIRGIAILGILVMNINSFGNVFALYMNPTAAGTPTPTEFATWALEHLLFEQKFYTLFSILFGAGLLMIGSRAVTDPRGATVLLIKRLCILLFIGLLHAYLLWYGDILTLYAIAGLALLWMRHQSARVQTITGLALILIPTLFSLLSAATLEHWLDAETAADLGAIWQPSAEQIRSETTAYRGDWLAQMSHRVPAALQMHTEFMLQFIWRIGGGMLLGMAMWQSGWLQGKKSARFYLLLGLTGITTGLLLTGLGIAGNIEHDFRLEYSFFTGSLYNYWGSLLQALGYLGLIVLWAKSAVAKRLQHRLAAVGRMALSNYLLQTLLATGLFYGHGLGLFGSLERHELLLPVAAIWLAQLIWSPIWLRHFRFGPAEWLWRTLTYGKRQPFRVALAPAS